MRRWFDLTPYTDPVLRQRALATYIVAVLVMLVMLPVTSTIIIAAAGTGQISGQFVVRTVLSILAGYGGGPLAIWLTRTARQRYAALVLFVVYGFVSVVILFAASRPIDGIGVLAIIFVMSLVTLAALLADTRVTALMVLVAFAELVVFGLRVRVPLDAESPWPTLIPFLVVTFGGLLIHTGGVVLLARGTNDAVQRANAQAARRFNLNEASAGVIRDLQPRMSMNTLHEQIALLIKRYFPDLAAIQVWMLDSDLRTASRVASTLSDTSEPTQTNIGSVNAVGRVLAVGTLLTQFQEDGARLLLPLRSGVDTIGVLELRGARAEQFDASSQAVYADFAAQLSTRLENARLLAQTEANLAENRRLYEDARTSLREIEQLNQRLTGMAWSEYLRGQQRAVGYTYDFKQRRLSDNADWTDTMETAAKGSSARLTSLPGGSLASFPLVVRGQVIGAMEFELESKPQPAQIAALQRVMDQMALIVDNTRLLEDTQQLARREAMVAEISERMQGATSIDSTLASVAQGLASVLNASRVAVRIGSVPEAELEP